MHVETTYINIVVPLGRKNRYLSLGGFIVHLLDVGNIYGQTFIAPALSATVAVVFVGSD